MKLLELFSGIGGFALGLKQAGFEFTHHYFSEIDKHAIANYKYNFPEAEYVGPVENVRNRNLQADIITFGSPCQDFSLAGNRAGLEGSRSGLLLTAIEIIKELDKNNILTFSKCSQYQSKTQLIIDGRDIPLAIELGIIEVVE